MWDIRIRNVWYKNIHFISRSCASRFAITLTSSERDIFTHTARPPSTLGANWLSICTLKPCTTSQTSFVMFVIIYYNERFCSKFKSVSSPERKRRTVSEPCQSIKTHLFVSNYVGIMGFAANARSQFISTSRKRRCFLHDFTRVTSRLRVMWEV